MNPTLSSLITLLNTLTEAEPLVAETVLPILSNAIDFAISSGKVTESGVWIRAFEAAATEVANKKFAQQWMNSSIVRG